MTSCETVLICPNQGRQIDLEEAIRKSGGRIVDVLAAYPSPPAVAALVRSACDAIIIELDSDPSAALELIEHINRASGVTLMVFSGSADPDLIVRCMRVGAREFLSSENMATVLRDAMDRAISRRAEYSAGQKGPAGKLVVFWGAKGGVGVTTLASNFAIALQKEAETGVALVDLNVQLGGVAVLLAMEPKFTILDALRHGDRLDRDFVSTLITEYRPGLSVLPAPDQYVPSVPITNGTVGKLFHILREQYRYVVVDAGPGLGASTEAMFAAADSIYVVTQADIPALRNAQRFIAHCKQAGHNALEVVLNRFEPRKLEYDEERITKALGLAARWKIANDYAGVRRASNTGSPLQLANSPIAHGIAQMARAACGKPLERKKAKFGFLGAF